MRIPGRFVCQFPFGPANHVFGKAKRLLVLFLRNDWRDATDELAAYDGIAYMRRGYRHRRIHHSSKVYVRGDVHTNTVEGFGSLLKRGIGGVYHAGSQKYLQAYLDEYPFRYNRRDANRPMFTLMVERVSERVS